DFTELATLACFAAHGYPTPDLLNNANKSYKAGTITLEQHKALRNPMDYQEAIQFLEDAFIDKLIDRHLSLQCPQEWREKYAQNLNDQNSIDSLNQRNQHCSWSP